MLSNGTVVKYKIVQIRINNINQLNSPLIKEVHSHAGFYIVTAGTGYLWVVAGIKIAETWAKGRFYVDYGHAVVDVNNLSYNWTPWYVWTCSFDKSNETPPQISLQVEADAHYVLPVGCPVAADHFDSHPRVSVDAWLNIDHWAFGNKWVGPCACV